VGVPAGAAAGGETPAGVVAVKATADDPSGWSASPADEKSSITLSSESPSEVRLALRGSGRVRLALRGSGRFQVDPRSGRPIRIEVTNMAVIVRNGRIEIEQRGERMWLAVREGSARVEWQQQTRTLSAGQEEWFSPTRGHAMAPSGPTEVAAAPAAAEPASPVASPAAPEAPAPVETDWRSLAKRGGFTEAFAALELGADPVRDETEDLLLAADTARLSGHLAAALPYLDRVLVDHSDDSRAPVAAFSKGRVLLELGRAGEAVNSFRLARGLAPEGALAEDAMAREVEALSRAGLSERAHALADEYVRKYPTGAWLRSVRRFGGL
jgi:transmembrane sensor